MALVQGLPAPLDEAGVHLIRKRAREQIADLAEQPTIVVTPSQAKNDPHWEAHVSWDSGRYHARFGHRYLSVHFVRQSEEGRYRTYAATMKPHIERWIGIYQNAFDSETKAHVVDRILYGYANTFEFDLAEGFDLSEFFRLNYGLHIGSTAPPLVRMSSSFEFPDSEETGTLRVELNAAPIGLSTEGQRQKLRVITQVVANRPAPEGTTFANPDRLLTELEKARRSAKTTFFGFTTDKTHDEMGAVRKDVSAGRR